MVQRTAPALAGQQRHLDLLRDGDLVQNLLQRGRNQVIQSREHTHQIRVRPGDGHILGKPEQLAAEGSPQEGEFQKLLLALVQLAALLHAHQVNPLAQLS